MCGDLARPHMLSLSFRALNDQQNQQIMRWSEDGNTVVIVDVQELTTKLLPNLNTTAYFSFTQQLRLHGFQKVEQGYL
jgi:heat shock transcription factor